MEKGKKEKQTTDNLRGILRGDDFEGDCTVALVTKLDHARPSVSVWTSLRITEALAELTAGWDLSARSAWSNV